MVDVPGSKGYTCRVRERLSYSFSQWQAIPMEYRLTETSGTRLEVVNRENPNSNVALPTPHHEFHCHPGDGLEM